MTLRQSGACPAADRFHSAFTRCSPRRLNWRNPSTFFTQPLGGSAIHQRHGSLIRAVTVASLPCCNAPRPTPHQKGNTMSIVSFLKEAGEKLFGGKEAQAAPSGTAAQANVAELNAKAGEAITAYIRSQG